MRIRIFIADRQKMFREALSQLLAKENDFEIVGNTGDGLDLLRSLPEVRPDILLIDLNLRRCSSVELLRHLDTLNMPVRPILLTDVNGKVALLDALRYGVHGIVWKHQPPKLLFKSIRSVMLGEYWINRSGIRKLVENLRALSVKVEQNTMLRADSLTPQQQHIVDLIAGGCSNNDIAKDLSISERTVKYHLTRIFHKLGVSSRIELARFTFKTPADEATDLH
jgi:DNA-binding NarL/FixJ family response regulator